jgi:hypothetical protein
MKYIVDDFFHFYLFSEIIFYFSHFLRITVLIKQRINNDIYFFIEPKKSKNQYKIFITIK